MHSPASDPVDPTDRPGPTQVPELTDAPEPRAWTVIYDADCGFCRWLLSLVLTADHQRRLVPLALGTRAADELLSDLSLGDQFASWHLVSPSGERQSAGAALPTLAALLPGGRLPAAALSHTGLINDRGYRWVAGHRSWFGRVIPGGAKDRASALIAERSTPQL